MVQWCRRRGRRECKRTPKGFDLSKILAKSGKKTWKFGQNPWKSGLKRRQTFAYKHKNTFFWRSYHKWSLWGKLFRQKSHKKFCGKFGEIRAKIFCTPKNLPAPTPMSWLIPVHPKWLLSCIIHSAKYYPRDQLTDSDTSIPKIRYHLDVGIWVSSVQTLGIWTCSLTCSIKQDNALARNRKAAIKNWNAARH